MNVLVTGGGRACVADFGLSAVAESEITRWTSLVSTAGVGGTVRWQAPELFDPAHEEARPTKLSDVYSLGCVFYEVRFMLESLSCVPHHYLDIHKQYPVSRSVARVHRNFLRAIREEAY